MTDLTIVYLKMRALAEAPQLMLSYRGSPIATGWPGTISARPGRR